MFDNFLKPFKRTILLTLYIILLVSGFFLWRIFTDTGIMFGNYGKVFTYIDITLSMVIITLFPLFLIGVIYKGLLFGKKETLNTKTSIGTGWWIIGTIISGASCCGSTLALSFGLLPLMNILPYNGMELKIIGLLGLLWALRDLYRNLETCQLQKDWWLQIAFEKEWKEYRHNRSNRVKKWYFLERLHILSQLSFPKHITIHGVMLYEAIRDKNVKEILGQCLRLFLVIPWHILQKLPLWNIWTSRVSAFQPMDIPDDLRHLFNK